MPRGGRRTGGRRSQPSTPKTTRTSNPATPSSGRGSDGLFSNGQWFCDCKPRRPAVLRETRKPGANKGRWFYTCPQERRRQCTFFLWEDYAGVSGGGAANGDPSSSTKAPRPTYRTSIGQRTTPPAERQDGPAPPHMTLAGQRSLPPPVPEQMARQRQRVFMTPTTSEFPENMAYSGYENHGGEDDDDEDEDDGFEPPPTPTPVRTRRTSGRVAAGASLDQPPAPPPAVETPSRHPITKYFGVVKKNGNAEAGDSSGSNGKNGAATGQAQRAMVPGRNASDYSDSEFDSDMERALVALADHSEQKTRQQSDAVGGETRVKIKQEEGMDDGGSMAMDIEDAGDRRRRIIIPVREEQPQQQEPETPTRRRLGRRLLVASDEYAAKEAAAAEAIAASATTTPTAAAPASVTSSFSSLFGRNRNGEPQQPHPIFSFTSSAPSSQAASQAASSQALTQESVDTAAMTTPPSSFRSEVGTSTGCGQKRRQVVDPWYGVPTQDDGNGNGDDESDDNNPFTTPSKRVRFREEATTSSPTPTPGRPTAAKDEPSEPVSAVTRQHWAEDDGMHVDREEEVAGQQGVQHASQEVLSLPASQQQPNDHNVTLAVLQLLAGQPIAPRVRQQVRALLNSAFAEE